MKFIEIELNDYRQFFGRQSLTLASGKEQNVTLINGPNGAGKTHLFEAINWCLYGQYIENRGAIVSKEKAVTADFGEEIECSVSIWYTHEGKQFVAVRKGRARKIKHIPSLIEEKEEIERYKGFKLQMLPPNEDDFKVFERTDSGMTPVSDPTITIDRALPENARQYFLFDGEKIEQLSKPEHDHEVREAVRNVLQLPSIERAIDHLKTVKRELLAKAKKVSKDVSEEDLFEAVEEIDRAKDEAIKAYKDRSTKINQVRELKSKIDQDLRKFSSIKELTQRRADLQRSYDSCRLRIKNIKARIVEILSNSHLITCLKLVEDSSALLENRRAKGQIPPGIRETFIRDLIEKGKCICGNDLSEGSQGRDEIEKFMLESRTSTRIAEELSEVMADLNQIKQANVELSRDLKKNLSDWISSIDELEEIVGRLEDVHSQIKKIGEPDIAKLEKSRRQCEDDERRLLKEQAQIEMKIREFATYIKDIESKLKKLAKSKGASGELARLSNLAEMAIKVFETVYEEFAKKKRAEIEDQLKKIFYKLMWKKDQFPDVRLTDGYSLELYDKYGSPAREELSAGERQVLSLSFITAMAFVTGGAIPLIMDTPFGRLFKEHRLNITKEIPKLTNQWVLLVQDEEINQDMIDLLMPRLGRKYELLFDDGCTQIKEV
jgi:DNA sulfur modification protein DndD